MQNETIRILTPADKPAYMRLMAQAFGRGRVATEEDSVWEEDFGSETAGAWAGGELRAVVTVRPFAVHWASAREGLLPMGGVAGVATSVETRGRGYVDRLLRDSLVRMRVAGQVVSALYPFSWGFYRKFGWEWVGEKRTITLPLREIKSTPEALFVREVPTESARALLAPIYERFGEARRGVFTSESHQWDKKLAHDDERTTFAYAYFPGGGDTPTAYLLWRYEEDGSENGEIREFVATTPDGYGALVGLLHNLGTQCRAATITAPSDTPLWSYLYHWDVKTRVEPTFQARVVDVAAAMGSLVRPQELADGATVTLQVSDEAAPWNNGTFEVAGDGDRLSCSPTLELGEPDVTLDIAAFSQGFWGFPSLGALRIAGRVRVNREAGYETLSRILPASPVFTMDYF